MKKLNKFKIWKITIKNKMIIKELLTKFTIENVLIKIISLKCKLNMKNKNFKFQMIIFKCKIIKAKTKGLIILQIILTIQ